LRSKAHRVTERLTARYGSPRHGNKDDPLDELVFIILSQVTTHWSFGRVYDALQERFPSWDAVLEAGVLALTDVIKHAGLSGQKAPRIVEILQRLRNDFGEVTLDRLREMDDAAAERYLTSLPGVGAKTAKCVLMYSLGRRVLPVDTHVWRVGSRLGLVDPRLGIAPGHAALEVAVAPSDRYAFHVNAIVHGREVCRAVRPRCAMCVLATICDSADETFDQAGRRQA
jgi:endonuclease III